MQSVICTLFEGDYHYGVGALVNSLHHQGFRGTIWAGYRGELPFWAKPLQLGGSYHEFSVDDGIIVRFVPLETKHHFTNYKPDFLQKIWEEFSPETEALFYVDPDIVIKCRWSFFEEWVSYGVALCEDVNSPMPDTHPIRLGWKRYFIPHGLKFEKELHLYVNGGFIGLTRKNILFLNNWKTILELIEPTIGSLEIGNLGDRSQLFCVTDQDALNIAIMTSSCPISLMGKDAMDIIPGGFVMAHALGTPKPWKKNMILSSFLRGRRPSLADKEYWKHTRYPIKLYSGPKLLWKKIDLLFGSAIGRLMA